MAAGGQAVAAASEGASVVVADYGGEINRRGAVSSEAADEVVGEIEAAGGKATVLTKTTANS